MEKLQNTIEFIEYHDSYKDILKKLTLEWLEKYVTVEPEDEKFIDDPRTYVLDKGGYIYFARCNSEIVGTVSLCRVNNDVYELAKLAVTEKYKRIKIGKQLLQFAIEKCKEIRAKKIILYTAKKLAAAYHLYIKFGFVEVEVEKQKYLGSDTKMELDLTKIYSVDI